MVVLLGLDVGVGDAGRVDQDVWGTELLDDRVDGLDDGAAVTDVDLVELDGDAGALVQLGRGRVAQILVGVEDDDGLCTGLGTGAGNRVS